MFSLLAASPERGFFRGPEPHVIEQGEPGEFPDCALGETVITPEVNRASEDAFKPVDKPRYCFPLLGKLNSSSSSDPERKCTHRLCCSERGHPDWNEPVLPKRKSEIGMSLNLKNEFPISARVQKCTVWRRAKRKTAQYERAGAKDQVRGTVFFLTVKYLDLPQSLPNDGGHHT